MNNDIVSRLGQFIDYLELNHSAFAKELGYSSQEKISRLFRKKGAKPSFELIFDIANKFAGSINAEWLLLGNGNMLKDSDPSFIAGNKPPFNNPLLYDSEESVYNNDKLAKILVDKLCSEKDRTIEALQKTVKAQEIAIESLLEKIKELPENRYKI